jgi:ComF family protein
MIRRLLTPLIELLFPSICHLCKEYIPNAGEVKLCPECLAKAPPLLSPKCSCCGRQFESHIGEDHLCGPCTTDPPPFSSARAALLFEGSTRELIHQFKYSQRVLLRRPLGLLAASYLDDCAREFGADLIVPVPLHSKRLRQRGFNQAVLLGEIFSQRWGVSLARNNLRRIRWTEPQVNLGAAERAANVKGAFALNEAKAIAGRKILLIDDVYTTGSTVKECCRVLLKAGAAEIGVLTVARGTG